jgi:uncharacterized protein (DUF3084 family)
MTTGVVLIAAILILGGVIATLGDRIGMRVGKARLSLFNLRPRQTATLISILTGGVISTSTLALLFLIDDQLRTGVFELEEIQAELETAQVDLEATRDEKDQIEEDLERALEQERVVQERLQDASDSLAAALARQEATESQLSQTQEELNAIESNFRAAQSQLATVMGQAASLRAEIQTLQAERQQVIAERDRQIADREAQIAERDRQIADREAQLQALEVQQQRLQAEVAALEREFQGLRQGNVALLRNQSLASGLVRVVDPNAAPDAVNELLRQANRTAFRLIVPGSTTTGVQIIQITTAQVDQLTEQIQDGQDYVVRILSAGNYVVGEPCALAGEPCIQVFAAAAPNQVVFFKDDVLASITINPVTISDMDLLDRYNFLISAAQFRARQSGVLAESIEIADGRTETVIDFFNELRTLTGPVELQAIAGDVLYTAGPVEIELAAVRNGEMLFSTETIRQRPNVPESSPSTFPRSSQSEP